MAAKKGFFQKTDQKKQYSENVLSNVDSAYRPKNRGRVKNPISSNTMSGEEAEEFAEPLTQQQDSAQQSRFKKPVGYAFAGPQAKRQKNQAQAEVIAPTQVEETVLEKQLEPEIQVRTGKQLKKKTSASMEKTAPKKSRKLSQPEIQVSTGNPYKKLSQPELQVRTGKLSKNVSLPEIPGNTDKPIAEPTLETTVAFERMQAAIMLEAIKELEVDVQETKGNYEPIEAAEVKVAKSLGFQKLFNLSPVTNELQYELDLDSIAMHEFQQAEVVEMQAQAQSFAVQPQPEIGLLEPQTEIVEWESPPKQGIKRSHRGTIEAVFQPNGKVVEAQYNRCGILIQVNIAGAIKLTRSADNGTWTMSYGDEDHPVNKVSNVSFDRLGNLCYSTEDGRTTVICADGRVVQK